MKTLLLLSLTLVLPNGGTDDTEHPRISTSSQEFVQGASTALNTLKGSTFEENLEGPSLGASSNDAFDKTVAEINSKFTMTALGTGEPGKLYDVILQPGHYLRSAGRVGTQGRYVSEQALVAYVTNVVAQSLRRTGESVLVVSADDYLRPTHKDGNFDGLRGRVFLSIHADGSEIPCTTGPSLGYQAPTTALTMHTIGLGLADALGYDYADFRKDNFTANETQYYMFRQVRAARLDGLLEVGELTCERTERKLILSSHAVGVNIARAIDFIVNEPAEKSTLDPISGNWVARHELPSSMGQWP
jgi:N-acetylmuramoyl-L-alanine amidase